jgi:hypothetical protein
MNPTRSISLLALLLATALAPSVDALTITRGPYLQMLSQNAVTLHWQTDVASDSRVLCGDSPATLTSVSNNAAAVTEHELRVNGLTPDTTYYYAIGTSTATLAGGDASFRFKTAPLPGTVKPTRIWVLGDSGTGQGTGTYGNSDRVRDGYYNSAIYQDPDLWLMLGDNAYDNGTELETTHAIFETYPTMLRKSTLWSTIGNHETYTNQGAPYFNAFTLPKNGECGGLASGTEHYYSFDYANIHFVCLDDALRTIGGAQLTWLASDLASTTQKWIIAFWHAPPYSKGSHNSDTEGGMGQIRTNFLPILESHGVDLVLCGHSHSYERSMLLNGHYGDSSTFDPLTMAKDSGNGRESGSGFTGAYQKPDGPNNGTVYLVGGNSGKTSGGTLNHPVMISSKNVLGSLVLDVNGNRLEAREIGTDGLVIDTFTLITGPLGPQLSPVGWNSVNDHAGAACALPILDNTFVEPRQAGLRSVQVTFSEAIVVGNPAGAVAVTGINAAGAVNPGALGISVNATAVRDTLLIGFADGGGARALPDAAKWRITLNPAAISGVSGATLAASAANSRVVTGLIGDNSGNGRTSGTDLNRIANSGLFNPLSTAHLRADINGDGVIDSADQDAAWANRHQRTDQLVQPGS